jgi:hypothetical protein
VGSNPTAPATNSQINHKKSLFTSSEFTSIQSESNSNFWGNFKLFLEKDYRGDWKNQIFNNTQKYVYCVSSGDLSILKTLSDGKRLNIMKSLSAYAKFSGCYEHYKQLVKAYGLKWSVNNDDIIIARLLKYSSDNGAPHDLFEWIKRVKSEIPALKTFMDFTIGTGLRFDEAINSYRLIVDLSKKQKLESYYNAEWGALEHFRFREIFIRRTKKAFMSFVPYQLIESVQLSNLDVTEDVVKKRLQRRQLPLKFSDLRELFASCSVKHLKQPEIDFLQGRVSTSVFMQNYFNPVWIADLKKRSIENANDLLNITRNIQDK